MKKVTNLLTVFLLLIIGFSNSFSQNLDFEAYKKFLKDNKNMTTEDLFKMYPPGVYKESAGLDPTKALFINEVRDSLQLTDYENQLIEKHGFMVTERISYPSFWDGFGYIFNKDLPVFISTDAILHSIHMSYDAILSDLEEIILIEKVANILMNLHQYSSNLDSIYRNNPQMKQFLYDYDIFFTIPLKLLGKNITPYYQENLNKVEEILNEINDKRMVSIKLFSETTKDIDFSQFTIRGHYTKNENLGQYFLAMMWLGRIELYLTPPKTSAIQPSFDDIQRQIIDALLILKAAEETKMTIEISKIDDILKVLIGESDNVQLTHLSDLLKECGFSDPSDLLVASNVELFQENLSNKSYSDQKILSQILWSFPNETEKVKPASAFLLFGQRFVIDSYITGNVVHDKIYKRMLPSSLEVLFVLGNNSASDLLKKDLNRYNQLPTQLAALRYLMESNDEEFWNSSFYNGWLQSIRTLSPPDDETRKELPEFMQTAAWWQEKMNTQCASWAQLRHDNLLYAKPSYSDILCYFPFGLVEPNPEFFRTVSNLAIYTNKKLSVFYKYMIDSTDQGYGKAYHIKYYFNRLDSISNQLAIIAEKELNSDTLSYSEKNLLLTAYSRELGMCPINCGWYWELFYNAFDVDKKDYVVADVHTATTDEFGNNKGYVWHIGTGPINMAVVLAKNWDGELTAFCGPVMSYYENVTLNFKRLTDKEWQTLYNSSDSYRPEFVDLYLARCNGEAGSNNPISLPTGIEEDPNNQALDEVKIICKPNPFTERVLIGLSLPSDNNMHRITASIYNLNGELVASLYDGTMPSSNYLISWDGKDRNGNSVSTGTYLYRLRIDDIDYTGKVVFNR